jgi:hypothetical protein
MVAAAGAGVTSKQLVNVHTNPGNFDDVALTIDATGAPAFVFGSDIPPASAVVYDRSGQLRWSFFNASAGDADKVFQVTAARHCESGGLGAGPVDLWVTENDVFNDTGFSVFGLATSAAAATPVFPGPVRSDFPYTPPL